MACSSAPTSLRGSWVKDAWKPGAVTLSADRRAWDLEIYSTLRNSGLKRKRGGPFFPGAGRRGEEPISAKRAAAASALQRNRSSGMCLEKEMHQEGLVPKVCKPTNPRSSCGTLEVREGHGAAPVCRPVGMRPRRSRCSSLSPKAGGNSHPSSEHLCRRNPPLPALPRVGLPALPRPSVDWRGLPSLGEGHLLSLISCFKH